MLHRPRRNRRTDTIRKLIRETILTPDKLVLPLFLIDGAQKKEHIDSLPGQYRQSLDHILKDIEACLSVGLRSFDIFPVIPEDLKDDVASYAYSQDNFYLKAARKIKETFPEVCLISDVALDPYSSDGHDGIYLGGYILNDETLPILSKMSLAQAQAGFDYIGPSDMMDGRVAHIRQSLDEQGFTQTGILSYTAKYASAFYGPFRNALDSAPKHGDKKTYQMDPANAKEALIEAQLDEMEGADILMVKPALHYLDVIYRLKEYSSQPIAAYHVSGECAMLLAACQNGWLDFNRAMPETLLSIHRAGADVIITYFARDYAQMYANNEID